MSEHVGTHGPATRTALHLSVDERFRKTLEEYKDKAEQAMARYDGLIEASGRDHVDAWEEDMDWYGRERISIIGDETTATEPMRLFKPDLTHVTLQGFLTDPEQSRSAPTLLQQGMIALLRGERTLNRDGEELLVAAEKLDPKDPHIPLAQAQLFRVISVMTAEEESRHSGKPAKMRSATNKSRGTRHR